MPLPERFRELFPTESTFSELRPSEGHRGHRIGWLRAAVLGANDGIVSTASLIVGVASADASQQSIMLAGAAGLVAGAMSMAAGEYVSVSSQSDVEKADLKLEHQEHAADYGFELSELTAIYVERGLDEALARQVATQLMARDSVGAHARDELGIVKSRSPRPVQAAIASAAAFSVGAALPLMTAAIAPVHHVPITVSASSLVSLALLGALSAYAGAAPILRAVARVTLLGALAMAVTAGIGSLFGVSGS